MTQQEFISIASYLRTAYPTSNFLPTQETVKTWYEDLKDLDSQICKNAMRNYVRNNDFPPTIAGIRKSCTAEVKGFAKPWDKAWGEVMAAVYKYGTYGSLQAMESFDDLTKKSVKAVGGFYAICTTNEGRDLNYMRRDFKENYEGYKQQHDYDTQASNSLIRIDVKEEREDDE
jgi:hypothetical protein